MQQKYFVQLIAAVGQVKKAVTVSAAQAIPEVPPPPDMSSLYLNGKFTDVN